jgi:hypothetical protein
MSIISNYVGFIFLIFIINVLLTLNTVLQIVFFRHCTNGKEKEWRKKGRGFFCGYGMFWYVAFPWTLSEKCWYPTYEGHINQKVVRGTIIIMWVGGFFLIFCVLYATLCSDRVSGTGFGVWNGRRKFAVMFSEII